MSFGKGYTTIFKSLRVNDGVGIQRFLIPCQRFLLKAVGSIGTGASFAQTLAVKRCVRLRCIKLFLIFCGFKNGFRFFKHVGNSVWHRPDERKDRLLLEIENFKQFIPKI